MKKILFSLSILFVLVSCSKDPMEILHGTWNLTRVEARSTVTGDEASSSATGSFTFNEDGTGSLNWNFDILGVNSTASGTFEWTANDNNITLTDSGGNTVFTRVENKKDLQVIRSEVSTTLDNLQIDYRLEK